VRRPVEPRLVEGRLADQRDRVRQMALDVLGGGGRAVMPDHAPEPLEPALGRLVEDALDPPRKRVEQDDALVGKQG
jgi:hypothetical protein